MRMPRTEDVVERGESFEGGQAVDIWRDMACGERGGKGD